MEEAGCCGAEREKEGLGKEGYEARQVVLLARNHIAVV
jgi:hypothetical protein